MEVQSKSNLRKPLLYPSAQVYDWGTTLVVSPCADNQWLGCAGAVALLRKMGYRVRTLFLGQPPCWSTAEDQMLVQGAAYLGVSEQAMAQLHLRHGLFPLPQQPGFDEAVRLLINELEDLEPDTVVVPTVGDDYTDAAATQQMVSEALRRFQVPIRTIEYERLDQQMRQKKVVQPTREYKVWRLDIREVMDDKLTALQHWRQANSPSLPEVLPAWETFLEYRA